MYSLETAATTYKRVACVLVKGSCHVCIVTAGYLCECWVSHFIIISKLNIMTTELSELHKQRNWHPKNKIT